MTISHIGASSWLKETFSCKSIYRPCPRKLNNVNDISSPLQHHTITVLSKEVEPQANIDYIGLISKVRSCPDAKIYQRAGGLRDIKAEQTNISSRSFNPIANCLLNSRISAMEITKRFLLQHTPPSTINRLIWLLNLLSDRMLNVLSQRLNTNNTLVGNEVVFPHTGFRHNTRMTHARDVPSQSTTNNYVNLTTMPPIKCGSPHLRLTYQPSHAPFQLRFRTT